MTQIVSSISGIEIYAPSAGYAPLDSASVSAIASGYQVVSATSTQTYAGTAYVTGVNSTPISAARAGNAVNAVNATSAWYDSTGREISSLPDASTVSSIASAYVDSGVSGKLDATASSMFQPSGSYVDQSAFDDCCSAMSGYVSSLSAEMSGKQDASGMSDYQPVSGMTAYAYASSVPAISTVVLPDPDVPDVPDDPVPETETCPNCGGSGVEPGCEAGTTCGDCGGTGILYNWVPCGTCEGTGIVDGDSCPDCGGSGGTTEEISCTTCGGSGIRQESVPCGTCGGTGVIET